MKYVVALLALASADLHPATGDALTTRLSHDDINTTEVHFFRASDVKTPLAKYTVATPTECNASTSHARYSRVRLGPKSAVKRAQRAQCEATGTCVAANFLALKAGEEVLVFAVNHRTGHSGMTRVTVPTVNRLQLGQDGGCAADNGGPSATYTEDGTTYALSACLTQELGIEAPVKLYPPEVDVRVSRATKEDGLQRDAPATLVRSGGGATTRDSYVKVETHWRVRLSPSTGETTTDGGSGCRRDGGCGPSGLQDVGPQGPVLEVACCDGPA